MGHHCHLHASHRYQESKRVTWYAAFSNGLLSITKVFVGIFGHSQALLADGIHSFSDLLVDFMVIIVAKYSAESADHNHPYGHARIETTGALGVALLVFLAGFGIVYDILSDWWHHELVHIPSLWVIAVAALSILFNETLFRYTQHIAKKINSNLLFANAWHNRSDALSSAVVLVGALSAHLGFIYGDMLAAIIVGLLIIRMSFHMALTSINELIDTGLENETILKIEKTVLDVPGVCAVHQLRTRTMSDHVLVDVHVIVDPLISVSEGHFIGEMVGVTLKKQFEMITDVTVHIDPENDSVMEDFPELPFRPEIINICETRWKDLPAYQSMVLHYLNGKINVDLYFKAAVSHSNAYQAALSDIPWIGKIQLFIHEAGEQK